MENRLKIASLLILTLFLFPQIYAADREITTTLPVQSNLIDAEDNYVDLTITAFVVLLVVLASIIGAVILYMLYSYLISCIT